MRRRDTAGMLELSDWEFETTMINMLRALMDKVDMQKQTGNVSRDGNPRGKPRRMIDIKNFVTEIKNAFDGLTSRLGAAEIQTWTIATKSNKIEKKKKKENKD